MSKYIFRHHYLVAASLLFAALIGLGAIHSQAIRNPNENTINGSGLSNDTTGQKRIAIDTGVDIKNFQAVVVDSSNTKWFVTEQGIVSYNCLLYTSDAADDLLCVDLGGR